ncbi:sensor histidine kinase [Anoxynatronum buryatiense]|uniref:histidine kinase n=1 Tax=Anoxynatronum buryatiense TaxID=489973 RepID=A0AA45WXA0_9CLOT|nr:MASE3 domain-containing protein [Anoxynatronum buryatiense]SMP63459.1 His Kinase A (phospho-acceptor) domain-containing protein [Anoxynatronum buryatiense]
MNRVKENNKLLSAFMYAALLVSLYLMTSNFLLFHAYAEGFAIVIAVLMFVITWNARHYIDDHYLHFIGLAYLFIANIDFLHVLGYTGMNIFPNYDYHANQLWVLGRYMESLTLLAGFYYLHQKKKCSELWVMMVYTLISALGILAIFVWKIFPEAFIAGVGQTPFKIISGYMVMGILMLVLVGLRYYRDHFGPHLVRLIGLSVAMTIISELFFTFYIDNYGISNVMGHYFKIISFYLIYKSIVEKGIQEPYEIIFRRLEKKRSQLTKANETKMKLFSIIGHDLRSPFNNLLGVVEVLTNDPRAFDPEEQKELFNELHETTKETYSLVNNLLSWASVNMEGLKLDTMEISPMEIMDEAVNGLKGILEKKALQINISGDPELTIMADAKSAEAIIRNLMSNAIKFSHTGGHINLSVHQDSREVIIQVQDHGVGMTPEQVEKLLVSEINESTVGTANERGTGLGFNIVREFVQLNQGRLEIDSQVDQGTVIRLFFQSPPRGLAAGR